MAEEFELKRLSEDHVGSAIERAEHYRLLNAPEQAESICLDVLEIEPESQKAIALLILSMTDQFGSRKSAPATEVRKLLKRLTGKYDQAYYAGLIHEREGNALLDRGPSRIFAYDAYRSAMTCFEKADELSEESNNDPILRWNSCARTITRKNLEPLDEDHAELGLE